MTSASRSFLRLLLRLFPRTFRERFRQDMMEAFEDRHAEVSEQGRLAVARLWMRTLKDLLRNGLQERRERRRFARAFQPRRGQMGGLRQDLLSAWRFSIRHPGSSAAILVLVALGIGACTSIFSLFNAVLLRPLPYPQAERLVDMWETYKVDQSMSVSYPNFKDWAAHNTAFESLGASARLTFVLRGKDRAEQLGGAGVTPEVFEILGINPLMGRWLSEADMALSASAAAVISQSLWQGQYGADPAVLGQDIVLDGKVRQIVGVMPAAFRFPNQYRNDVWVPLPAEVADDLGHRGSHPGIRVLGRLKPGVRLDQARSDMQRVAHQLQQSYPATNRENGVGLQLLQDLYVSDYRPALRILLAGVGFLLLVACANLANLSLARNSERRREFSIRLALGAGRLRLMRQVLAECLMLSLIGSGLGICLAWLLTQTGRSALARPLSALGVQGSLFDWRVAAFAVALCLLTGIAFGLAPAFFGSRTRSRQALQIRTQIGLRGGSRLRSLLVLAEVALSAVLLCGAGLALRSMWELVSLDAGFEVENLATLRISPAGAEYGDVADKRAFYRRVLQRLEQVGGVESAAIVHPLPLVGWGNQWRLRFEGSPTAPPDERVRSDVARVSSGYFRTMGIRVLEGRTFSEADGESDLAVIDQTMAHKYFPGGALGRKIHIGETALQVIGVVGHVKHYGVNRESRIQLYLNSERTPLGGMTFVVRTAPPASTMLVALRDAAAEVDPMQPAYMLATMEDYYANNIASEDLTARLLLGFAAFALLLAGLGLYGVIAYLVGQSKGEIGVRLALGASPRSVKVRLIGKGLGSALAGIALGIPAALALGGLMADQLHGVSPRDPLTLAGVCLLLFSVSVAAAWAPARRAARIDPAAALRWE